MNYMQLSEEELLSLKSELEEKFEEIKRSGLKLDMSRGKPSPAQLDLSDDILTEYGTYTTEKGIDARNYGLLDGVPEVKEYFGKALGLNPNNIVMGGNASLNLEYDCFNRFWVFGTQGCTPWGKLPKVRFICFVPGYDRHFAILEEYGVEMINVPLYDDGPDMDMVEEIVKNDPAVKGVFCVPLYSNPTGCCFSNEKVERLAKMETAAEDFRIFWDNAYGIHHLYDEGEKLADIFELCEKYGNENRVIYFFSTSKITYAGAGVSLMAASPAMIKEIKSHMTYQTIGFDKINQLRTLNFFKTHGGIFEQMKKHAALLRPKFEMVINRFREEFTDSGILTWTEPRGGYFISVETLEGCAKELVSLCREAGLVLTGAGATYPKKQDPNNSNIRIAPSYPSEEELSKALDVFCVCLKLVSVNKLLSNKKGA